MKKSHRAVAAILIMAMTLLPIYAETVSSKKNQLNSAKEHIKDSNAKLKMTKAQREQIEAEIKKFDTQIVKLQDKIAQSEKKIKQKQKEIEKKEAELEVATKKKDDQYESTKERMVQMYKNQNMGYMEIIFSSNDFWEAINRAEYINRISEQDNNLIKEYEDQIKTIEEKKQNIEDEKTDLTIINESQIAQQEELKSQKGEKDKLVAKLVGQENELKAEIVEMQEMSDQLEKDIQRLVKEQEAEAARKAREQAASSNGGGVSSVTGSSTIYSSGTTSYTGGAFLWPVPGFYSISSEYNPRTSPISGKSEFHTGIDIPASYASDVVAAADGVVISAGWINGYGNTVLINHGGGLVTLYGHNSSLVVSTGQTVTKGQTIAKVGSTGYSTGNHCHFEVRVNGAHTSPWNYLSK